MHFSTNVGLRVTFLPCVLDSTSTSQHIASVSLPVLCATNTNQQSPNPPHLPTAPPEQTQSPHFVSRLLDHSYCIVFPNALIGAAYHGHREDTRRNRILLTSKSVARPVYAQMTDNGRLRDFANVPLSAQRIMSS